MTSDADFSRIRARLDELGPGTRWFPIAGKPYEPAELRCSACSDLGWITTRRQCGVCGNVDNRPAPRGMP